MGILDVILGRDAQGQPSKINMALIALLLWRWYQSQGAGGAHAEPIPAPSGGGAPRMPRQQMPQPDAPEQIPTSRPGSGNEFDELRDSVRPVPRGGSADAGASDGGMGGGGLGDILGDILGGGAGRGRGGQAGPAGGPGGGGQGGGGLGDILGDILGGGATRGGAGRGQAGPGGGGLGDILGDILGGGAGRGMPGARVSGQQGDPLGGLGGLLAGGGGVLGDILSQFEQAGKGDAAKSWVSRGENVPVTPTDIENTFGSGIIDTLSQQFGLPRDELLKGLSQAMPDAINELTPDGRLPTPEEISRRV